MGPCALCELMIFRKRKRSRYEKYGFEYNLLRRIIYVMLSFVSSRAGDAN